MITANSYQDIQIMQDADFENIISFDAASYDVDDSLFNLYLKYSH